jgi:hypothetical protein
MSLSDPVEKIVAEALDAGGYQFVTGDDPRAMGLDFYLTELNLHIEVKQFHSDRIAEQTARVDNVIVVQGRHAAGVLRNILLAGKI